MMMLSSAFTSALIGSSGSNALLPVLLGVVGLIAFFYLNRLTRLSRQVWDDYGIQLGPLQALALLRRQALQIVGGRQLRYDETNRRAILS